MELALTAGYTAFFCFLILKLKFFQSDKISAKVFTLVFLLKIIAGIFIGKFFLSTYGGGDTWQFFNDGNVLFSSICESPVKFFKLILGINDPALSAYYSKMLNWYNSYDFMTNDARIVIRMSALIRIFSLGYYNVHVVVFCFLSLTGLTAIFKTFCAVASKKEMEFFITTLLIPSVFFWSSGVLKESILFFSLGMFVYYFFKIITGENNLLNKVCCFLFLVLLLQIKVYVLLFLLPGLIAMWWSYKSGLKHTALKFVLCYGVFYLIAFNIHHLVPKLDLPYLIYQKQFSMRRFAIYMGAKSYFYVSPMAPYGYSLIKHVPESIWNTLARPYLTEANTMFLKTASGENILLLLAIAFSLFRVKRNTNFNQPLFWLSVFFVIHLFALAGLTTCLFGSLIRYKVPALPFLLFIFVYISDFSKSKKLSSD